MSRSTRRDSATGRRFPKRQCDPSRALEPAARRPATFTIGGTPFVFDTHVPGNHNIGHELGTRLSAGQKRDLAAFLRSL